MKSSEARAENAAYRLLVGKRLRFLREAADMNQVELAEATGYEGGNTMISQAENGKKMPSISQMKKLAEVFGVPVEVLLSPEDYDENWLRRFSYLGRLAKRKTPSRHLAAIDSILELASKEK